MLGQSRHRHVLVSDDDGHVVGVISSNDLIQCLADSGGADRSEWATKTVDAIMTTHFLASRPEADASDITSMLAGGSIHCIPVLEDDQLVGVLTADDLLFSWNLLARYVVDWLTRSANRSHRFSYASSPSRGKTTTLTWTIRS